LRNWLDSFNPFRTSELSRRRIAEGLMMYETDDEAKPITFRFTDGETKAQYSLTRSEIKYLATLLNEHLDKGSSI
jgi:hypothetical protein